jgi:cation:H+ antiporter
MIVVSLGAAADGARRRDRPRRRRGARRGEHRLHLLLIRISRREAAKVHSEYDRRTARPTSRETRAAGRCTRCSSLIGLALLVVGSAGSSTAPSPLPALGVSELIIGLTIIAAGTSLPEVATSIIAGLRGERDIAVGNVVGSNLFNILVVVGITAIVSPGGLRVAPAAINFDMPVMIAAACCACRSSS